MEPKKFNKDMVKTLTKRFSSDVIAIIYNGIVHQTSKTKILKQIKDEIRVLDTRIGNFGELSPRDKHFLWLESYSAYYWTSKLAFSSLRKTNGSINYQEKLKSRSTVVFDTLFNRIIGPGTLVKAANDVANNIEAHYKRSYLQDLLDNHEDSPFYLCSWHANCAKDHLKWQGTIYVDENWEKYVPEDKKNACRAYIRNHNVKTLQWVTGPEGGVWMTTRPNCKHFFIHLTLDETLKGSMRKNLITHKMIVREVPKTNADRYCRAYKEQLDTLTDLWKIMSNDKLGQKLKDTKALYKKWLRLGNKTK